MNRFAKCLLFLTLLAIPATSLFGASAEVLEAMSRSRSLVGTWELEVAPVDCQTGAPVAPPFSSVQVYLPSGAVTEEASVIGPPPIAQRTSGLGIWRRVGVREYRVLLRIFRFDSNGAPLDRADVELSIELRRNRDELVGAGRIDSIAPDGTQLGTICSTSTGRRMDF